ncbi:MAG: hypothetical protein IPM39_28180 [Chloroflexi bacterium]|nr:hypothetical protein [Chloroflexota bacterium]
MTSQTELAPNPVDHLFLLVGSNPLPNYVAASLLTNDNATIHLLYSEDTDTQKNIPSTRDEAGYLADVFKNDLILQTRGVQVASPRGIHDSNRRAIENQLEIICDDAGLTCSTKTSIGLNYTGATKPMSVHTYRALVARFGTRCRFSYLDPRRMAFWYDNSADPYCISHTDVTLSLQTLAAMHGYTVGTPPRQTPEFPDLLPFLKEIHQTSAGMQAWTAWLDTKMAAFPEHERLTNIRQYFLNLCDGRADTNLLADRLGRKKHKGLVSYDKAFRSGWLEDVALEAIIANSREFQIAHYGAEIKPTPNPQREAQFQQKGLKVPEFDLDVAAMLGYQLFAVSCIASERAKGETKKHLFEAYLRARQLGGDEARIALVCYVDDGQKMELESVIQRNWHIQENIKVFGRSDIPNLVEAFRNWFCTNSLIRGGC